MTKTCEGCGCILQFSDPSKEGFAKSINHILCKRCFDLKNYSKEVVVAPSYKNSEIIDIINQNATQVFFITDFINLSEDVINLFKEINAFNKYLVINKIDYIPNSINFEKYKIWIKEEYKINNDIILVSALKNKNINQLNNLINKSKLNYFCGFTNSGKSSIIQMIAQLNDKEINIVSSLLPNTTLDVINVNLNDDVKVIDTPGFMNDEQMYDKNLHPKKYIKPRTFKTKPNDVLKIGEDIFIKTDDKTNSFTFYVSNSLIIKKDYKTKTIKQKEYCVPSNSDVVLKGIGFINIKNKCSIKINENIQVEIRNSMF